MKKTILIAAISLAFGTLQAQDTFKKDVATAKTAYNSGKLEDAHFALQQTLQSLDITIGKEVLKLLPEKVDTAKANLKDDRVTGNIGFVGATIHRSYGVEPKNTEVEIVNNSPLIGTLNAFMTSPMLAGLGADGKSKVVKIQGYKARITREDNGDNTPESYRVEIPFGSALITINANNTTQDSALALANSLPLDKIAKLIQ